MQRLAGVSIRASAVVADSSLDVTKVCTRICVTGRGVFVYGL